jgi:hypothetical protein
MPKTPSRKLTITVPGDLMDKMEDMAHHRDMTMSKLAAQLLRLGMKSLEYPDLPKESPLRGVDPSGPEY